ncbi:MAG: hypothetical protein INR62_12370 [Rhodospirillales bacterium]|nr:hypothetical protein [Acetobacter sp.]
MPLPSNVLAARFCCLPWVFAAVACLLSACEGPGPFLEPLIYAKRGGMAPSTERLFFTSGVDVFIREELAGNPAPGHLTWQQYWQERYDLLRVAIIHGDPQGPWCIEYIHQSRRANHLPLYDNGKPPSKAVYGP